MKMRRFNMVEVMLAVVVIALGMASVFVLFPTGLTAHKTATAENSIADLAEYIFSTVKAQVDIESSGEATGDDSNTYKKFEKGTWTKFEDKDSDKDIMGGNESDWTPVGESTLSASDRLTKDSLLRHNSSGNVFWIRQMSGPANNRFVDFSAIGRVYVDRNVSSTSTDTGLGSEYFLDANGARSKLESLTPAAIRSTPRRFILPLVLEISYPAESPYVNREKQYFRFEIFNENYEPIP